MIKISHEHWVEIKKYLPKRLAVVTEENSSRYGQGFPAKVLHIGEDKKGKGIMGACGILAEHWAIAPALKEDRSEYTFRSCFLFIPNGAVTPAFKNTQDAMKVWRRVKHLRIHFDTEEELRDSEDFEEFQNVCQRWAFRNGGTGFIYCNLFF